MNLRPESERCKCHLLDRHYDPRTMTCGRCGGRVVPPKSNHKGKVR